MAADISDVVSINVVLGSSRTCLSIFLFVLFEVCGTVLVNCLLYEFAICVDVTEGLLLKEIV